MTLRQHNDNVPRTTQTDAPEVHKLGQVTAHSDHDSFEAEELACEVFVVVRVPPRATVVACRWVASLN